MTRDFQIGLMSELDSLVNGSTSFDFDFLMSLLFFALSLSRAIFSGLRSGDGLTIPVEFSETVLTQRALRSIR